MILRPVPERDDRVSAGTVDPDDVVQVEADAALRLVRNPEGYLSGTDGNYTYMLQPGTGAGRLEIFPQEWEILGLVKSHMSFLVPTFSMLT